MGKPNNHDSLGDRMKEFYENRTKNYIPRKTYGIIRVDGKAFHTLTKGLIRPFDSGFITIMDETAKYMCENVQGAKFGYVQSDEISILFTDIDEIGTDMWFDGNIQKICSVSASLATLMFNNMSKYYPPLSNKVGLFDSRVFTISLIDEVVNYFIWRQNDASRNSVNSVAQSLYSAKQLNGKCIKEMLDMIHDKGLNWNNYATGYKRGRAIYKVTTNEKTNDGQTYTRNKWIIDQNMPILTEDKFFVSKTLLNIE